MMGFLPNIFFPKSSDMNLLYKIKNLADSFIKPNTKHLLLIDGDNLSPKTLSNIIPHEVMNYNLKIEIFCTIENSSRWIKSEQFSKANFLLVKTKPQEADLRIKSRVIELACLKSKKAKLTKIYFASNDKTFIEDVTHLSQKFDVTYISQHSLCSNTNLKTINTTHNLTLNEKQLIKLSMPLFNVGIILKKNGVTYQGKLTKFLIYQGFKVSNGIITSVPYK